MLLVILFRCVQTPLIVVAIGPHLSCGNLYSSYSGCSFARARLATGCNLICRSCVSCSRPTTTAMTNICSRCKWSVGKQDLLPPRLARSARFSYWHWRWRLWLIGCISAWEVLFSLLLTALSRPSLSACSQVTRWGIAKPCSHLYLLGYYHNHSQRRKAMLASLPPWLLPQPQPTSQSHARIFTSLATTTTTANVAKPCSHLSTWLPPQPQPTPQHRTTSLNGQRTSPILNAPHHRTPPLTLQHALARKWKNRNLDLAVQSVLCSLYVYLIILLQVGLERRGVQRRYIEVREDRSVYGVYLTTTHNRNLHESSKSLHRVIVVALVDDVLDCNH